MNYKIFYPVCLLILGVFLISLDSCKTPVSRNRIKVGDADHSAEIIDVGTNPDLSAPKDVLIVNNKTARHSYLLLRWTSVPGAESYRVYRAVYPVHTYKADLPDRAFKRLVELKPEDPYHENIIEFRNDLPFVPLRRYAYRITSVNSNGESDFSPALEGYRLPVDEEEALRDIDYTIHFAQSSIAGFGQQGLNVIVPGRASGFYYYISEVSKIKSQFENYADFETILNGNPKMAVNFNPLGTKMNGSITVSGLYKAVLTYNDLIGVVGGLTKGGSITISYEHPVQGTLTAVYPYQQAKTLMKSVITSSSEALCRPPVSEWDEASPDYIRSARKAALRSLRSMP